MNWFTLTDKKSGKSILVNLASASTIWPIEGGSEIWFLTNAGFEGKIQVTQTPDDLKKLFDEMQRPKAS